MPARILVLADPADAGAAALAARLGTDAVLAVPATLSAPGWTYRPDPLRRSGSVGGRPVVVTDLAAVVVRLLAVFPHHLPHVVAADREYVAAEMTAFLRAWLADLPCPVVNPASALDLSGPGWTTEGWAVAAARAGVPFLPVQRTAPQPDPTAWEAGRRRASEVVVTVAGPFVAAGAPVDDHLVTAARALAEAGRLTFASVGFASTDSCVDPRSESTAAATFVEPRPDLSDPVAADLAGRALRRWLR